MAADPWAGIGDNVGNRVYWGGRTAARNAGDPIMSRPLPGGGGGGDFGPTPTRRRRPPVAEPSRAPGAGGGPTRYIRSGAPVGGGVRRGNPATTKAWQTQAANKALLEFVMSHYAGGLQQGVYNKLLANEFQPPQRGLMGQVKSSAPPMYVDF